MSSPATDSELDAEQAECAVDVRDVGSQPRAEVVNAAVWVAVGYGASQVLRLATNLVLSRLLFPEAFGLMAMVTSMLQGLEMFSDLGIGPSIIQSRRGDEPQFLNTAWTIQIARGLVVWLGAVLLTWPAAHFYNQPELLWLLPCAGLAAALGGLNSTSLFTAKRNLWLGRLIAFDLTAQALASAVSCVWAWVSPGLSALLAWGLVSVVFKAVGSHFLFPGNRNRPHWNADVAREVLGFGKWIFVTSLVTFLAMQSDRLVLGKLFSTRMLGVYNVGASFAVLPQAMLTIVSTTLIYPLLSRNSRNSQADLVASLRRVRETILPVSIVLVLATFIEADILFGFLYDERYQMASSIVQVVSATVWVSILSTTLDPALLALGDSRSTALAGIIRFLANVASSIAGFYLAGLWGFLGGLLCGMLSGHVVLLLCLRRHGIHIVTQDLRFSLLLMALVLGVLASSMVGPVFGIVLPQLVLLTTAVWAGSKLLRLVRPSSSNSASY
jgi:O-antigen/teichoic acid export membrane protein